MHELWPTPGDAESRFRTLELIATHSTDSVAFRGMMERDVEEHRRRHGPKSAVIFTSSRARREDGSDDSGDDRWTRQVLHIWWRPPTHWREESTFPGYPATVVVVRPDVSLSWLPPLETLCTTEPEPLITGVRDRLRRLVRRMHDRKTPFDSMPPATIPDRVAQLPLTNPRLPAADWELTTVGQEEYLGRAVRRVRATRRPGALTAADGWRWSGYWSMGEVDEYECLVDDELRILLHLTGKADGAPVGIVSVDELRVNAAHPDDVFTFVPPTGARIVRQR